MNSNLKGNIALGKAISYFATQGYIISIPLNDSQCYDLIIEKNGKVQLVQVKYTNQQLNSGNYCCRLQVCNKQTTYYTLNNTYCDLLFCYCGNGDAYLIPVSRIENTNQITLFKQKSKYTPDKIFDTSQFYIANLI